MEGIDVFGPAGFNQLADSITEWAGMLLEGKEFDAETEQCRFEIAVQSCRSQAKLLEEIAAGKSMEAQAVGGNRYNFVFLLQTLWFAFDLKSDSALRRALFHSLKVLYPNTRHNFFEEIVSDSTMPLPSRSILTRSARAESAECLRMWIHMSGTEQQSAHS